MTVIEKRLDRMKSYLDSEDYKSYSERVTLNLSRAERREYERKEEKLKKCVKSLTPMHYELIEQLADMKASTIADEKIGEFRDTLDRAMTAILIHALPDKEWEYIDKLIDKLAELVHEDVTKILEIEKECKGDKEIMNKTMQKYQDEVKIKCEELIGQGLGQKQAIEVLVSQFPSLSKSMLTNAYKKLKSEWDNQHKKDIIDPDVEEAAEAIMDIIEEPKEEERVDKIFEEADKFAQEAEKEQPKVVCDGDSCSIEATSEVTVGKKEIIEDKPKGLKVLSMTVKGENGTYRVCEQGVELAGSNMIVSFQNVEQLEEWIKEFKEVFSMIK